MCAKNDPVKIAARHCRLSSVVWSHRHMDWPFSRGRWTLHANVVAWTRRQKLWLLYRSTGSQHFYLISISICLATIITRNLCGIGIAVSQKINLNKWCRNSVRYRHENLSDHKEDWTRNFSDSCPKHVIQSRKTICLTLSLRPFRLFIILCSQSSEKIT